jgi:hypothetical protein
VAIADDGSASPAVTVASGQVLALDDHRLAWLAEEDTSDEVQVYELATLHRLARLPLSPEHRVEAACFVADGALILGLDDGRVLRGAPRTVVASGQ